MLALHWSLEDGKGIDDFLVRQDDPTSALKELIQNARNAIRHFGQNLSADTIVEVFAEAAAQYGLHVNQFGDELKILLNTNKKDAVKQVKQRVRRLLNEQKKEDLKNNQEFVEKLFDIKIRQFPDDFGIVNGNLVKLDVRKEDIKI